MPTKRYSTAQIVSQLRQAEVELGRGCRVPQMCKKLGISEQTYYRWRLEYGGLRLDQAKRLKELERENTQLGVSERRACRVLGQARATQRRRARVPDDEPMLVRAKPTASGRVTRRASSDPACCGGKGVGSPSGEGRFGPGRRTYPCMIGKVWPTSDGNANITSLSFRSFGGRVCEEESVWSVT